MSDTTYTDFVTVILAAWLNDVNNAVYRAIGTGVAGTAPATPAAVLSNLGLNSGAFEWVKGPTPTFVGSTSFTVVGNQTALFPTGRRLRTTNTGGVVYGYVVSSTFAAATTVNVLNDSGAIDAGLSAVDLGILSPTQFSLPAGSNLPMVNARNNADQIAGTTAIFQTAFVNRNTILNLGTGVFTAPITSDYFFGGVVSIGNTSGGSVDRNMTLTGSSGGLMFGLKQTCPNSSTTEFGFNFCTRLVTNETISVVFDAAFTAAIIGVNSRCFFTARAMP